MAVRRRSYKRKRSDRSRRIILAATSSRSRGFEGTVLEAIETNDDESTDNDRSRVSGSTASDGNGSSSPDKGRTATSGKVKALKAWLRTFEGCHGIDGIVIPKADKPGVWLRSAKKATRKDVAFGKTQKSDLGVKRGGAAIIVPRHAWISVPVPDCGEIDAETALAWRLLEEKWKGAASDYAPYVDFLWCQNLDDHPMFWTEGEVSLLSGCIAAHEDVVEMRRQTDERISRMLEKAKSPESPVQYLLEADMTEGGSSSSSSGVIDVSNSSSNINDNGNSDDNNNIDNNDNNNNNDDSSDAGSLTTAASKSDAFKKTLEWQMRFALCLAECRGIQAQGAVPGADPVVAFVPVVDQFRHDATGRPKLEVGELPDIYGGPFVVEALEYLPPETELKQCFEPLSTTKLFAHYGIVPCAEEGDEENESKGNAYNRVQLPCRVSPETWNDVTPSEKAIKLKLLAERAGFDMREEAKGDPTSRLVLPFDFMPQGRMLPAARFINSEVRKKRSEGKTEEEACVELFEEAFRDCDPNLMTGKALDEDFLSGSFRPPIRPPPSSIEDIGFEMASRVTAWEWCERILDKYNRLSDLVYSCLPKKAQEVADKESPAAAGAGAVLDAGAAGVEDNPLIGEIVMAHFKAKGGTKSRQTKDARVLSVNSDEGQVLVQFLENGVRHSIPEDWLVVIKNEMGDDESEDEDEVSEESAVDDSATKDDPSASTSALATATTSAMTTGALNANFMKFKRPTIKPRRAILLLELLGSEVALIEVVYKMASNYVKIGNPIMDDQAKGGKATKSAMDDLRKAWQQEQTMFRGEEEWTES